MQGFKEAQITTGTGTKRDISPFSRSKLSTRNCLSEQTNIPENFLHDESHTGIHIKPQSKTISPPIRPFGIMDCAGRKELSLRKTEFFKSSTHYPTSFQVRHALRTYSMMEDSLSKTEIYASCKSSNYKHFLGYDDE
ncbi:hypothetical protein AVEN_219783-1 [Araneus ventricosus]|uniref:Uncharacterized protein n=1 Tax=Araneus ventricosus TaxID=182803 RepID=A0A4Y2VB64_ARAVE|nr:hypothetical protein AVEN_219783-1 [Araneus ventricosus]